MEKVVRRINRALKTPTLFGRAVNRIYYRYLSQNNPDESGIDVFSEDWDTLIILDACRNDMFRECIDSQTGTLESRISRGSSTVEFLQRNLHKQEYTDTVYVTANPQLYRNQDEIETNLHAKIEVWQQEGWDEDHDTVLPETVTNHAINAREAYPNKRLIVHYIQPHYPFLGSTGEFDKNHLSSDGSGEENVWGKMMNGSLDITRDELWDLYTDNLRRVLPEVYRLLEEIDGKTVVTADHGNMVGERAFPIPIQEWGHPRGIYTEELVRVPWFIHESGERPEITAETPKREEGDEFDEEVVAERLRTLGYTE